jgi:hemin uptake protein HemP
MKLKVGRLRHVRQVDTSPPRKIASQDRLKGQKEVLIDHEGMIDKLRMTKAGKVILNKP